MSTLASMQSRPFFIGLGLLMGLIALLGFWPTYFGPLIDGSLLKPVRVHVHAVVYTGWLLLFLSQASLAALGNIKWHIRLGKIGIGYGVLLILVGIYTAVARAAVENRDFIGPFLDMVVFALFFAPAVYYRKKPDLHKRLMIVASTMLLVAAVGRMWFMPELPALLRRPTFFGIWFSPIVLAIVYDYFKNQRIHPIYVLGILAFFFRIFSTGYIAQTQAWITFSDFAISLFS